MNNKILYLLISLFLFSCSSSNDVVSNNRIQKRKYTKGYNFKKYGKTKHKNNNEVKVTDFNQLVERQIEKSKNNTPQISDLVSLKNLDFSHSNEVEKLIQTYITKNKIEISDRKIKKASKKISKFATNNESIISTLLTGCDELIMTDGTELTVKILEITPYEIKYKNCDNVDGPTFTKSLSTVFKIKYANGTSQVMNSPQQNNNNNDGTVEGQKSQAIAIGLWFFLGMIGVHRFYLGHVGIGILYFLTLGLCGIGWLVDGILFLTGDLQPKNGKGYGDKIL
jgi:TM2 domain-containing membrane protein YozV